MTLQQLAQSYCENEGYRTNMSSPFRLSDWVYATDGTALMRVPHEDCKEWALEQSTTKPPNVEKVFNQIRALADSDIFVAIDRDEISRHAELFLEACREHEKCKDCDGDGIVEWTYTDRAGEEHARDEDCPVCDGTGSETFPPTPLYVRIGVRVFDVLLVKKLLDVQQLTGEPIRLVNGNNPDQGNLGAAFSVGRVDVLLMPCVRLSKNDLTRIVYTASLAQEVQP